MLILFVGDVVAKGGRQVLFSSLEAFEAEYDIDLVVVNGENAAGGFGVTRAVVEEFFAHGVDVLTSGNHAWDKREALEFIDEMPRLLRPHNYPPGTPGSGWYVATARNGERVGILNTMGRVFMHPDLDCPFRCADEVLAARPADVKTVLVDFHAEASSEKVAMGWYLDGRVSAVVGTHTHVPTADERLLPQGTAYISDVGMTGCYNSVIGMKTDLSLGRFVSKLPQRLEPANGPATLSAVLIDVDERSGRARRIERIRRGSEL
ncbi:MAG: TIGR00282 family metallophosphoesterase [Proteobacteria bacterium]|nr:MAG: TIGR00282 family metallophosphoesterase [Pseudomonadota bacterium]